MLFASKRVLADRLRETETLYEDEVQDGIAHAAKEQADVWALAAAEDGNKHDPFVASLVALTGDLLRARTAEGATTRAGEMGTKSRLQPRFQKNQQAAFDQVCSRRTSCEKEVRAAQLERARMEQEWVEREEQEMRKKVGGDRRREDTGPMKNLASLYGHAAADRDDDDDDGHRTPIVLVPGSTQFRAGFAGDDGPASIFPSKVGMPRHCGVMVGMGQKDSYIGNEAQAKRGILTLKHPITSGHVTNWDGLEKLLHHALHNELRVDPSEHPVLVTDSPCASSKEREKLCQTLFETFNVPHLHVTTKPLLSLYASGRVTGVCVHVGSSTMLAMPIYEGYGLAHAIRSSRVGGDDVTDFLLRILTERGYSFTTTSERDIVRDIKEKLAYVAHDFHEEMETASTHPTSIEKAYELPDGQTIAFGNERFRCAEVLFNPTFTGSSDRGLAELIYDVIVACDIDIRSDLWLNIVLSGGSSLFPGMAERLEAELRMRAPSSQRVRVLAPPERKDSPFVGGSVLASLVDFSSIGISRETYLREGPSVIHRACMEGGYGRIAPTPPPVHPRKSPVEVQQASNPPSAPETPSDVEKPPKTTKGDAVAAIQRKADTNCALLQIGRIVQGGVAAMASATAASTLPPTSCDCGAILLGGEESGSVGSCYICTPISSPSSASPDGAPTIQHVLLSAAAKSDQIEAFKETLPVAPMVIFAIDVSGSMGTVCKSSSIGTSVTRLQCMQQAVREQLTALREQQPDCVIGLVTFSNEVRVFIDGGHGSLSISSSEMRSVSAAMTRGAALQSQMNAPVGTAARTLLSRVDGLRSGGATALGSALAVSVGIAAATPTSRVVLFTDGLANTGLGAITKGSDNPFYTEIASNAAHVGVTVDVLTLEGEECSMENLGTTADVSGGSVAVVDPQSMQSKVASLLCKKTIATGVEATLILPKGLHALPAAKDAQATDAEEPPTDDEMKMGIELAMTPSRRLHVLPLTCGAVTEDAEVSVRFGCDASLIDTQRELQLSTQAVAEVDAWELVDGEEAERASPPMTATGDHEALQANVSDAAPLLPVQLQLRYTLASGTQMLSVVTSTLRVATDREEAEADVDSTVSSLAAIHHAATLAQEGEYLKARTTLIGTQRLLQRVMKTSVQQRAYLNFIVQAEKLDGFMRERQATELVFGRCCSGKDRKVQRDDEAATAMYQMKTVTSSAFNDRT
jgi:actin-related protein